MRKVIVQEYNRSHEEIANKGYHFTDEETY